MSTHNVGFTQEDWKRGRVPAGAKQCEAVRSFGPARGPYIPRRCTLLSGHAARHCSHRHIDSVETFVWEP